MVLSGRERSQVGRQGQRAEPAELSKFVKRTTGIEPATLSLGIGTRTARLSGNPVTTQKTRRSEPLETAANGY